MFWGGDCVVDDAYLLRLYDVLPEDIIIGVAGLNILHFGRRSDQAELICFVALTVAYPRLIERRASSAGDCNALLRIVGLLSQYFLDGYLGPDGPTGLLFVVAFPDQILAGAHPQEIALLGRLGKPEDLLARGGAFS